MLKFFTYLIASIHLWFMPLGQAFAYNVMEYEQTIYKNYQAQGFFYGISACLMGYALYLLIRGVKQKELKVMKFRIVWLLFCCVYGISVGVMFGHMAENHSPSCPAGKGTGLFVSTC